MGLDKKKKTNTKKKKKKTNNTPPHTKRDNQKAKIGIKSNC